MRNEPHSPLRSQRPQKDERIFSAKTENIRTLFKKGIF